MKINKVEIVPLSLPISRTLTISRGKETSCRLIILKVHTDEGITGYGEIMELPAYSGISLESIYYAQKNYLTDAIIGQDPFDIERIFARMNSALPFNECAKSAIDIALHDIMGKSTGLPVYKLLGGNFGKVPVTGALVDIMPPDESAEYAKMQIKKLGVRNVKVKIGDPDSIKRVEAIREAIGPNIKIRVDANAGYRVDEALRVIRGLEPYDLELVEQPVAGQDLQGMCEIKNQVDIPIEADESVNTIQDALKVIKMNAADIILIKFQKPGGLYYSKKLAGIAEAAGIPCVAGGAFGGAFSKVACQHLATATSQLQKGYACEGPMPWHGKPGESKINLLKESLLETTYKEGFITAPNKPGLGVEPNEEMIEKYRIHSFK